MLDISNEKLSLIIALAREYDEGLPDNDDDEDDVHIDDVLDDDVIEDHGYDLAYQELKASLISLDSDEQAAVVALVWIGRGTYDPDEIEEALQEAAELDSARVPDYLIGTPLLPEYLEEGMTRLGIELEEL